MTWFRSRPQASAEIPIPPIELRELVGQTKAEFFDNPTGGFVFPEFPPEMYAFVLDFGCGCGRIARQLLQQQTRPDRYVGVDLHRGMIRWCQQNLQARASGFEFHHQNIHNAGLNPGGSETTVAFPVPDGVVTLLLAWSVFTHMDQAAAEFYLREISRVLAPGGAAITTWFLFDKSDFPMMQDFQNALFINATDPTNAVIFDKAWLADTASRSGLVPTRIVAPDVRGFQWRVVFQRQAADRRPAVFPEDLAPKGVVRPPLMPVHAETLGDRAPERED